MVRATRIDPFSLALFISAIQEGTIAAVAHKHHMAASAVSKRISELEMGLGVSLVRRTNRGIEPTPAGHVLLLGAKKVLLDLEEIRHNMEQFAACVRGQVRLLANLSSITEFLPSDLSSFLAQHPDVQVQIEEARSSDVIRAIIEGTADVGVFTPSGHVQGVEIFPYQVDELVLITPSNHPLHGSTVVSFESTLEYDYVGLHDEAVAQLVDEAAKTKKSLRLRIQVSGLDAMCAMVGAGLGIGVAPRNSVMPYAAGHSLKVIRLNEPWVTRQLFLCVRSSSSLNAAGRQLLDHLIRRAISPPSTRTAKVRP